MINRETGTFKRTYAEDLAIYRTPLPKVAVALIALVVFVIIPWQSGAYWLGVLNLIGIASLGALGLNILVGYTGQISVGHAAFMSVGAYTAAVILREFPGTHWLIAMLGGGFVAALVGTQPVALRGSPPGAQGQLAAVPAWRAAGLYCGPAARVLIAYCE